MTRLSRLLIACLTICIVTLIFTSPVGAGTFTVYACQFPDGRLASTAGWAVVAPKAGTRYDTKCTDRTGMSVIMLGDRVYPPGYSTGIGVVAPEDLSIANARAKVMRRSSGTQYWTALAESWGIWPNRPGWNPIDVCGGSPDCGSTPGTYQPLSVPFNPPLRGVGWAVACSPYRASCPRGTASAAVSSMEMIVRDDHRPTFTARPSGTLLDPNVLTPHRHISFAAADRGSGVTRAELVADGRVVSTLSLGHRGKACVPPYDSFRPCPLRASGVLSLDTARLQPGIHTGRLLVHDASDNPPLIHEFTFRTLYPGEDPATVVLCDPSRPVQATFGGSAVPYGASRIRFFVYNHAGLPDEAVIAEGQGRMRATASARRKQHVFRATVPPGPSRVVRLAFPVFAGAVIHRCSAEAPMRVRAGLQFRVAPRRVANGDTIRLAGRLLGGSVARHRNVLIQARARGGPRRWLPVRVLRTNTRGRFRMRYRFRRTRERVRFEFRAVTRTDKSFPYVRGSSRTRAVLVRG